MKSVIGKTILLLALGTSLAACNSLTPAQRNTAIGAAVGGAAGSMIGGDTGAILGGAALGLLCRRFFVPRQDMKTPPEAIRRRFFMARFTPNGRGWRQSGCRGGVPASVAN